MDGKRQFSLRYLLLEMLLIGLALGLSRLVVVFWGHESNSAAVVRVVSLIVGLACWGAAFGGLFGRMGMGALTALGLFGFWLIFLAPSVQ